MIEIIKGCGIRGVRHPVGARLTEGTDVSAADAQLLLAMGRAKPVDEKPRAASRTARQAKEDGDSESE
jgi:hypothetical protein